MRCFMRAVVIIVVFETILAGLFVGSAGRWDLPWFWTLLGIHTVVMGANMWVMDPDLKKERMTLRRREGMDRSMRALIMPFVLLPDTSISAVMVHELFVMDGAAASGRATMPG